MSNLPLNINFTQIFLHLLNFLILYAILYFLLYKPVKNFMEKREKTYRDMDDEARDNLKASEEKKAQYDTKLSEAEAEISQMKSKSRQEIEKSKETQLQAAKDDAERIGKPREGKDPFRCPVRDLRDGHRRYGETGSESYRRRSLRSVPGRCRSGRKEGIRL